MKRNRRQPVTGGDAHIGWGCEQCRDKRRDKMRTEHTQKTSDERRVNQFFALYTISQCFGCRRDQDVYSCCPIALTMSESPPSVMLMEETRKYLPHAVPSSMLSAREAVEVRETGIWQKKKGNGY